MERIAELAELVKRARTLDEAAREAGRRRILGVTGAPGAGKGTVARRVRDGFDSPPVLLPMDGFHLAGSELRRLGRHDRKGAPDTFDAAGYVALLRRVWQAAETVYAPEFRREWEEPIAGAIPVEPVAGLVITEGNYLLLDRGPWSAVRELLDEVWFLEPEDAVRVERLIARHVHYGKSPEQARAWVQRSDERNAGLIAPTRARADVVVPGDPV